MFSNKKQGSRYQIDQNIAKFMIKFEVLAMKTKTDNMHMIFLLKKNIRSDIIKTILGYPLIAAPKSLKEWKVAIKSPRQWYESIEDRQDYKTESEITYRKKKKHL